MPDESHDIALLQAALATLNEAHRELRAEFHEFRAAQTKTNAKQEALNAVINLKAGAWSFIAGAIMVLAAILMRFL